jgi:hypothetical protein
VGSTDVLRDALALELDGVVDAGLLEEFGLVVPAVLDDVVLAALAGPLEDDGGAGTSSGTGPRTESRESA